MFLLKVINLDTKFLYPNSEASFIFGGLTHVYLLIQGFDRNLYYEYLGCLET